MEFIQACGLTICPKTILQSHETLAKVLMKKAAEVAQGPHMLAFDNVQVSMSKHFTQRPGAIPMVSSFTTIILYSLKRALLEACRLGPILERRKIAPMITYEEHILPSQTEMVSISVHIARDIIKILMENTKGFTLADYAELLKHETHRPPQDNDKITYEYVLRTAEIDESTTVGCLEVLRHSYKDQLELLDEIFKDLGIPCINDQLTNARVRRGQIERQGDKTAFCRLQCFQIGIGLFHLAMNLAWHILYTHKGSEDTPGSLAFYAKYLNIRRVIKERPDYYTLRSFLYHVLFANILYAWSIKTGQSDLTKFAETTPGHCDLLTTALEILADFASDKGLGQCEETETLRRNTILLNRDLLYYFELECAISSGDFGRIEQLLGILASMFNGAGGKNYCNEILHLIQNLKSSWPENFALVNSYYLLLLITDELLQSNVMRDNMLISMNGRDNHFTGVDLNIEHNINYQKVRNLLSISFFSIH